MDIRIEPFTVYASISNYIGVGNTAAQPQLNNGYPQSHADTPYDPITYWGLYLDDRYVTHTSDRELAERTKVWMEKWLKRPN